MNEINIDNFIFNLGDHQIKILDEENPSLNTILAGLYNSDIKVVKFKIKFSESIFNKKNIISHDVENNLEVPYCHHLLERTYDIFSNFKCNGHKVTISFSHIFRRYSPSSTIPISILNFESVYLNILLDEVPTKDIDLQISYDAYIIANEYKSLFINNKIINNNGMIFMNGMFKGITK